MGAREYEFLLECLTRYLTNESSERIEHDV